jgi:hypothetical protein
MVQAVRNSHQEAVGPTVHMWVQMAVHFQRLAFLPAVCIAAPGESLYETNLVRRRRPMPAP